MKLLPKATPNEGVGTRYLELVASGMTKDAAARRALAEIAAQKRGAR